MSQNDIQKTVGLDIGFTNAVPATDDAAGFAALTFTLADSCLITQYTAPVETWDTEVDNSFCPDPSGAKKTKPTISEATLTMNYDKTNATFYNLLKAAQKSNNAVVSVDVIHPNGTDHRYYTAQVKECNNVYGDSSASVTSQIVLIPQTATVEVDA